MNLSVDQIKDMYNKDKFTEIIDLIGTDIETLKELPIEFFFFLGNSLCFIGEYVKAFDLATQFEKSVSFDFTIEKDIIKQTILNDVKLHAISITDHTNDIVPEIISFSKENTEKILNSVSNHDLYYIGWHFRRIGFTYFLLSNLEGVTYYFSHSQTIAEKISSKKLLTTIKVDNSVNSSEEDNFSFEHILKEIKDSDDFFNRARCLNNLAYSYILNSDLSKVVDLLQESLDLNTKINHKVRISVVEDNFGNYYRATNSLELAIVHYKKALAISMEINSNFFSIAVLFRIFISFVDSNDLVQAKETFKTMERLKINQKDEISLYLLSLTEALIFKNSSRMRDKVKAQQLLEELVHSKTVVPFSSDYKRIALISLIEVNIFELSTDYDADLLHQTISLLNLFYNSNTSLLSVNITILVLKSKLSLLNNDFEIAQEYLNSALQLAKETEDIQLITTVEHEIEKVTAEITDWKQDLDNKMNLAEKVNKLEMQSYINDARKLIDLYKCADN